ncbi:MAG: CBS domain-containing protein [Lachnotalea sp.]
MRVKAIMIPFSKLTCINLNENLDKAMEVIDSNNLLSLPVVEGKKFIGVLSKQYTYEYFFKEYDKSKEEFLKNPVSLLMKSKIETVKEDMRIEDVAILFITSKVRFVPITNQVGELIGIVTQQAVFKQYQKMFGHKHNSIVIYTYDYKGVGAKIMDTISKAGGDIRNMMMFHTDVMDLVEIFFRIDTKDFDRVLKALEKQKFDVRDVKYAEKLNQ